mmetsp:Transcript_36190/g.58485  ORF Transcript_36190/g.58485 Transcript_36190/m.58485 type:complete len:220 (-) Transcript_36190:398-1057(-)|eukprot:CAMPEP_0184644890 /NCGR_PEP_ID=MMETSP0308-20130426/1499_1 /TAXON_ID=38269 /ORGANISM="Gloeochaete witrockiana, Strain SAG 46.84" /LENGTH=219 /DNA_ID=CAMNT_0027073623 /DNA_START=119 /DNA_END=778 /DNA_ORIENTATION=-
MAAKVLLFATLFLVVSIPALASFLSDVLSEDVVEAVQRSRARAAELLRDDMITEVLGNKQFADSMDLMKKLAESFDLSFPKFAGPQCQLEESATEYTVTCDAPGLDAKALKVHIEQGVLTISGKVPVPQSTEAQTSDKAPSSQNQFHHSFNLPGLESTTVQDVKASFKDGKLSIHATKVPPPAWEQLEVPIEIMDGPLKLSEPAFNVGNVHRPISDELR